MPRAKKCECPIEWLMIHEPLEFVGKKYVSEDSIGELLSLYPSPLPGHKRVSALWCESSASITEPSKIQMCLSLTT